MPSLIWNLAHSQINHRLPDILPNLLPVAKIAPIKAGTASLFCRLANMSDKSCAWPCYQQPAHPFNGKPQGGCLNEQAAGFSLLVLRALLKVGFKAKQNETRHFRGLPSLTHTHKQTRSTLRARKGDAA